MPQTHVYVVDVRGAGVHDAPGSPYQAPASMSGSSHVPAIDGPLAVRQASVLKIESVAGPEPDEGSHAARRVGRNVEEPDGSHVDPHTERKTWSKP